MDDHNGEDDDDDELEDDHDDEEQGEREGMSDQEITELEECVQPVRLVLGKANCLNSASNCCLLIQHVAAQDCFYN